VLLDHIERLIAQEKQRRGSNRIAYFGDRLSLLTPTETKVLNAVLQGKSIKDIAHARKTSVQTVWRHQSEILRKVGMKNQIELVRVVTQWRIQQGHQSRIADH